MADNDITPGSGDPAPEQNGSARPAPARRPATRTVSVTRAPVKDDPLEVLPSSAAIPAFRPGIPVGPSPALLQREANTDFLNDRAHLSSMLSELEFGEGKFSIGLRRLAPLSFRGRPCGGYKGTFRERMTLDDIKNRFGGQKWEITIFRTNGFGKNEIHKKFIEEVEGDPILESEDPHHAPQQRQGLAPEVVDLVKTTIEKSDKQVERLETENRESRNLLMSQMVKGDSGMKEMFLAMQNPQGRAEDLRRFELQLQKEREDKKDALAAEERRRQEDQKKYEREKQEREERWERQQQDEKRRHEELMAAMKVDAERARMEAKEAQTERQRLEQERLNSQKENMTFMMQMMQTQTQTQIAAIQAANQQQLVGMQAVDQMKTQFFEKITSKRDDDPVTTMLKYKQLFNELQGGDEDEKATWEKVMDRVGDVAPSILAAAGLAQVGRSAAKQQEREDEEDAADEGRSARRRRRRRVKPGSVAVAELPPPNTREGAGNIAAADEKKPVEIVEARKPAEDDNDLKKFTFPDDANIPQDDKYMEEVVKLLVRNIDLAMEREYMPQGIIDEVILKFPPHIVLILKGAPIDELIAQIRQVVPTTWRINSPDGHKKLAEIHAILQRSK